VRCDPMKLSRDYRTSNTYQSNIIFNDAPMPPSPQRNSNVVDDARKSLPTYKSSIQFDDSIPPPAERSPTGTSLYPDGRKSVTLAEGLVPESVDTTKVYFGAGKRRIDEPLGASQISNSTVGRRHFGTGQTQSSQMAGVMKDKEGGGPSRLESQLTASDAMSVRTARKMVPPPEKKEEKTKVSYKRIFQHNEMPDYMKLQMHGQYELEKEIASQQGSQRKSTIGLEDLSADPPPAQDEEEEEEEEDPLKKEMEAQAAMAEQEERKRIDAEVAEAEMNAKMNGLNVRNGTTDGDVSVRGRVRRDIRSSPDNPFVQEPPMHTSAALKAQATTATSVAASIPSSAGSGMRAAGVRTPANENTETQSAYGMLSGRKHAYGNRNHTSSAMAAVLSNN